MAWLRSWWDGAGASRRVAALNRRLDRMEAEQERIRARIAADRRALSAEAKRIRDRTAEDERRLQDMIDAVTDRLDEARRLQKLYEDELATVRAEKQVLEDVTVPGLVEAHRVITETMRARTAIEVMRQAVHGTQSEA